MWEGEGLGHEGRGSGGEWRGADLGGPLVWRVHRMWEGERLGHEDHSLCCGRGCLTGGSWKCATDHFCQ